MSLDKDALDFAGFPEAGVAPSQEKRQATPKRPAPLPEPKAKSTNDPVVGTPAATPQTKRSSVATGVWVLIGVLGLVSLFYTLSDEGSSPSTQASRTSVGAPSTTPQWNLNIEYTKPPVGSNNILSVAQIRWCLREDIRIEALRPLLTTNQEVTVFNTMVNDYNRRCANFRYERAAMDRASREVERIRSQIVAAARQEWRSTPPSAIRAPSASTSGSFSSDGQSTGRSTATREVQNLLTQLGYSPGPVDGLYGPRTRAAIVAFQRDRGMHADGQVSASLRMRLMDDVRRGCDFKRIMTNADYRRCGITPPNER